MSMIWIDNFSQYGTGSSAKAIMVDGIYGQANGGGPTQAVARVAGGWSYDCYPNASPTDVELRRIFYSSDGIAGVGFAALYPVLDGHTQLQRFSFRDYGNIEQMYFRVLSNGGIECRRGDGTLMATTGAGQVLAGEWVYLEMRVWAHNSTGIYELRVNGFTVLYAENVDTQASGLAGVGQFSIIGDYIPWSVGNQLYITDFSGFVEGGPEPAAGFFGDKHVVSMRLDGDSSPSAWGVYGAPNAWQAVGEAAHDGDGSYLYSTTPGDVTELTMADTVPITEAIGQVLGVQVYHVQRKLLPGTVKTRLDIHSGGSIGAGVSRPVTENWTGYTDKFLTDPATGKLWEPNGLDSATVRITHEA